GGDRPAVVAALVGGGAVLEGTGESGGDAGGQDGGNGDGTGPETRHGHGDSPGLTGTLQTPCQSPGDAPNGRSSPGRRHTNRGHFKKAPRVAVNGSPIVP